MNIEFAGYTGDTGSAEDSAQVSVVMAPVQSSTRKVSVYAENIVDAGDMGDDKLFDIVLGLTIYDEAEMGDFRTFRVVKRISLNKAVLADQAIQNTDVTVLESSSGGFLNDPKTLARFKQLAGV